MDLPRPWNEHPECRHYIDDLMKSEQNKALPEAKFESLENALSAIPLDAATDDAVDAACNPASRIASRCFNTAKLLLA
jgi:hypothetical protein